MITSIQFVFFYFCWPIIQDNPCFSFGAGDLQTYIHTLEHPALTGKGFIQAFHW